MSTYQIDAKRLICPMPVIKLQEKIKALSVGDTVEIVCTDKGVLYDIPAWCRVHGHKLINCETVKGEIIIKVEVSG